MLGVLQRTQRKRWTCLKIFFFKKKVKILPLDLGPSNLLANSENPQPLSTKVIGQTMKNHKAHFLRLPG